MLRRIVTLVIACASIGAWADEPAADPAGLPAYRARFDRARPLIAVVGLNAGTEVTDFVVPYGILTHAGVADVMALATGPGPIKMRPALVIEPHATIEQFDQRFAQGADYVIVPAVAMGRHNDPVLRKRARKSLGATRRWRWKATRIASSDGKPQRSAMRATGRLPSVSSRRAASRRSIST